jgi:hypothetical protein
MVTRKLNETVKEFYLNGRLDEDFVMDAVKHTFGGEVKRSTKYEDMVKHVDFWWNSPKKGWIGIDVKGLNKSNRNDASFDDTIHWLEIQNVNGNNGWLKGDAEYIAFRTMKNIIFVNREKLLNFALESIKGKEVVYDTPKECYVPYKRKKWGRDDLALKARTEDLEKIADFCIDYENGC